MEYLKHLIDKNISAFYVNKKGQLCIPNHEYPKMEAIFNKLVEHNGNIFFGFSKDYISPEKGW